MNIDSSLLENEIFNETTDPEEVNDTSGDTIPSQKYNFIIRTGDLLFNAFFITPLVIIFW
jgi:hypothetical protein